MDEKILIYLIIGIIYFLFNRLKKKAPEDEQEMETPPGQSPESTSPRPMSFEELLREITEGKQQQNQPPPVREREPDYRPVPAQPAYIDYDDDIEAEEKSLEKVSFDEERTNKVYEDAKKMAFNRPSLEESLKLADVNTTYGKFSEFDRKAEPNLLLEYTKDLRDPKGFKKALILSEILNRKHF